MALRFHKAMLTCFSMKPHNNPWLHAVALAFESNHVIALRLAKLAAGGSPARAEASRMVSEKISEAWGAGLTLMAGGSGAKVIAQYRKRVAANSRRLSDPKR
jgi:hypothetical protein